MGTDDGEAVGIRNCPCRSRVIVCICVSSHIIFTGSKNLGVRDNTWGPSIGRKAKNKNRNRQNELETVNSFAIEEPAVVLFQRHGGGGGGGSGGTVIVLFRITFLCPGNGTKKEGKE